MDIKLHDWRSGFLAGYELGPGKFVLWFSILNAVLFQWPLYTLAATTRTSWDLGAALAVATLFVLQLTFSMTVFGLCAAISIRLLKCLCAVVSVLNAAALYFIVQYNITLDATMIGNIVGTNLKEAAELAHPKLLLYVLGFGVLPAVFVAQLRIARTGRLRRVAVVVLSLVLGSAWLYANAASWLWMDKNGKAFGGLVLPWSYVINAIRYVNMEAERHRVARPLPAITAKTPGGIVFVLVIGEAARARNFSLYGYPRETNPLLKDDGVIVYAGARSCATYTTASLCCMLSHRGAAGIAGNDEPLPSYLHRYGVEVIWRTNNFGEPPLKVDRYETADAIRKNCKQNCIHLDYDEELLHGLDVLLRSGQPDTKTLVVLHQGGSHGPQYARKYPPEFASFRPACESVELQKCAPGELVNAYDNTIVYTDYVLHRLIQLLKAVNDRPTVMLYMSDHGESLGEGGLYLHGVPMAIAPEVQVAVPLLVWTSDAFVRSGGRARIPSSLQAAAAPDVIFHSVMGAMGMRSSVYDPDKDVFSARKAAASAGTKTD